MGDAMSLTGQWSSPKKMKLEVHSIETWQTITSSETGTKARGPGRWVEKNARDGQASCSFRDKP